MNKLYRICFSILQKVMLVVGLHWIFSVLWQLNNLIGWSAGVVALLLFYRRGEVLKLLKKPYGWLMERKWLVMLVVVLFQLSLLLSAELLIRRDAAVVFTGAFGYLKESSISNYLTRNPNNMPLFLYERFFFKLFGTGALWLMQGLNLFYADVTAGILYWGAKRHFSQKVADLVFAFYVALLGFSPYFMAMYTDILILPLVSLQLFLALEVLKDKAAQIRPLLLLGLVTALAMIFRPTVLIVLVALFGVLLFKISWKKWLLSLLLLGFTFSLPYGLATYAVKHQTEVPLVSGKGLAKGPLLFINLGLTYTGTDQTDMKEGLLQYIEPSQRGNYNNGMFATENVIKEIKRRLAAYTPLTFLAHSEYKQRWSVMDGTLDWIYYEDVADEKTAYVSPLYSLMEGNPLTDFIRSHFITYDAEEYRTFATIKQLVWLVMAGGLLAALVKFRSEDVPLNFLSLAVFGGLLFLTIFEGGKTRYLIQFLPQILVLSSLGWVNYRQKSRN